ncbi:hypothetical protein D3C87_2068770 [compost metagenome]
MKGVRLACGGVFVGDEGVWVVPLYCGQVAEMHPPKHHEEHAEAWRKPVQLDVIVDVVNHPGFPPNTFGALAKISGR